MKEFSDDNFNVTKTRKFSFIMAVCDAYMFPVFLTPVLTQPSVKSHQLLFSHPSAEVGGGEHTPERKVRFNRVLNLRPPGHESDTPTTEPPGRGSRSNPYAADSKRIMIINTYFDWLNLSPHNSNF